MRARSQIGRTDLAHLTSMNISDAAFRIETRIALPDDEVHLWCVALDKVAPAQQRLELILSDGERERAARFHFSKDRECFTATRALLRTILAAYLACDPKDLVFRYSEKEKPSLNSGYSGTPVEFNVSHSGTIGLLAFTRGRQLGVDVERIRADFDHEAIARRFFSEHELRQLASLPPAERDRGFFRCWTRKEAFIKATGSGLSVPLHQFDVSLRPADENALLATRPDSSEAACWSLRDVPTSGGYTAALCVQGHGWSLKF
jgi:4'-phosphopantetheinyl transferase